MGRGAKERPAACGRGRGGDRTPAQDRQRRPVALHAVLWALALLSLTALGAAAEDSGVPPASPDPTNRESSTDPGSGAPSGAPQAPSGQAATPAVDSTVPAPGDPPARDPFADDPLLRSPLDPGKTGSSDPGTASADDVAPSSPFHLKGYVKNETAFRTSRPREFSKILNVAQGEGTWSPFEVLDLVAVVRAHYDAVFDAENGFSAEAENAYEAEVSLREAYADFHSGPWRVRAGRQQIVWGETIGLKVLDLVNPQDFREFILDDFIDSRIPLTSLRVEWLAGDAGPFEDITLEGIWIPHLRFHEPPEPGSEYFVPPPEAPPGVRVVQHRTDEPPETLGNSEWGLRVRSVVDAWDLSVSYFQTWDDTPVSIRRFDPTTFTLTVEPEHRRARILGGSVSNAFGKLVVSAEVAYWFGRAFDTEDLSEGQGVVRHDFLNAGVGLDYEVFGIDVGLQYFQSIVLDSDSDLVGNRTQSAASLHLRETFLKDDLTVTGFLLHDLETDDQWVRFEAGYDLTDDLNLKLGMDILEGKERGALGRFDHTDRVTLEVKWSF